MRLRGVPNELAVRILFRRKLGQSETMSQLVRGNVITLNRKFCTWYKKKKFQFQKTEKYDLRRENFKNKLGLHHDNTIATGSQCEISVVFKVGLRQ